MNRVLIALCLAMAANLAAQEPAPSEPAPKLVVDQAVYNFGEVDSSQDVSHTYILRNEGNLTLLIQNVRPACGCTVANLSTKEIPPGGQAELSTKLSLKGRQGLQRKSITVESNDPQNPRLMLYLEGTAAATIQLSPDRVFFGSIDPGVETARTLALQIKQDGYKLAGVESTVEQVKAEVETVEEGRLYNIHVRAVPPLSSGKLNGFVRIRWETGQPDINVPISAVVVGSLMVAPQEIVLTEQGGQPVTRYVVVRPGQVKAFEITGVTPPDPAMQVDITSMGDNGYRLQINNIIATADLNDKPLRIQTTSADMPVIEIPFKVLSQR